MANQVSAVTKYRVIAGFIASWYGLSTALSVYNKALLSTEHYGLHFPLFMSAIHSGVHAVITRTIMKRYCREELYPLSVRETLRKIVPCSFAAVLEISLSNASLVHTRLSFYTMIKSSTPVWMLMFSSLFGLTRLDRGLLVSTLLIVVGVVLTIEQGSSNFDSKGLVLVSSAAIASGLRWTLIQLLLRKNTSASSVKQQTEQQQSHLSPVATMYHMSPLMFVTMLLLSWQIEKPQEVFLAHASDQVNMIIFFTRSVFIMALGGVLAFLMTLAEIHLVERTSTLTLSLAGISKEMLVIGLSVAVYGDVLTAKTYLGLLISIMGIFYYNYSRQHSGSENRKRQVRAQVTKNL